MRTIDRVMEILNEHPQGLTTADLTRLVYPDIRDYEMDGRRSVIYGKLRGLEKYGMVSHTDPERRGGAKYVWTVNA